jgi:type I restriction enzyme M protein
MLATLPDHFYKDRAIFEQALDKAAKSAGIKLAPPLRKAILTALGERDESAAICLDKDGNPEPDPELRDTENVPLNQDIQAYFEREVQPYVPDAWVNTAIRDHKDKQVGKVGYEINFNRYFYTYQPPRPLSEIEADIKTLERDILELLREVAG